MIDETASAGTLLASSCSIHTGKNFTIGTINGATVGGNDSATDSWARKPRSSAKPSGILP
jgi:hypothetical protein